MSSSFGRSSRNPSIEDRDRRRDRSRDRYRDRSDRYGDSGYRSRGGDRDSGFRGSRGGFRDTYDNRDNDFAAVTGNEARGFSSSPLIPFRKNFYVEHSSVAGLSDKDVEEIRNKLNMRVKSGVDVPKPITEFNYAGFPDTILNTIKKAGFDKPSPIQVQAWPIAMAGRDFIGIAQTGSGKTLAFLLPAIIHIRAQPPLNRDDGPIALVLAPTRELADQIRAEANTFGASSGVVNAIAYGGVPKRAQIMDLKKGAEILIATPGRLIDFLSTNITNMRRVTYLVLDEADRMLDMGFEPQIKKIVSYIRPDRQTLMLSATWPKTIERFAMNLFKADSKPIHIVIGQEDLRANPDVTQSILVCRSFEKDNLLVEILRKSSKQDKCLIFTATKREADRVRSLLDRQGLGVLSIHGDKRQEERTWTLAEFKSGRHPILVATDVASRGIDVRDVKVVINYDFPQDIESYVHRIGRTGRAGAKGESYSLFTDNDSRLSQELSGLLREAGQEVPKELMNMRHFKGKGGGYNDRGGDRRGGYRGGYNDNRGYDAGNQQYAGANMMYNHIPMYGQQMYAQQMYGMPAAYGQMMANGQVAAMQYGQQAPPDTTVTDPNVYPK